jgi:hypothetical protein
MARYFVVKHTYVKILEAVDAQDAIAKAGNVAVWFENIDTREVDAGTHERAWEQINVACEAREQGDEAIDENYDPFYNEPPFEPDSLAHDIYDAGGDPRTGEMPTWGSVE